MFFNREFVSEEELYYLNNVIVGLENPENFCLVHELVNRNKVTSKKRLILKETRRYTLRPFRFLINKN